MHVSLNKAMIGTLAAGFVVGFGMPAYSQQAQPAQPAQQEQKDNPAAKLQELRQRSQTIQQKLEEIARKANEKNPDIEKTQLRLQELYQGKLDEHGYPSDEELQGLREMQQRLQTADDLDAEERQQLTQEFNEKIGVMREAEQKARGDEEVQKALEKLEKMRSEAMNEVDESAEDLQQELQELQTEIQKLQQEQFQQQQQGQ